MYLIIIVNLAGRILSGIGDIIPCGIMDITVIAMVIHTIGIMITIIGIIMQVTLQDIEPMLVPELETMMVNAAEVEAAGMTVEEQDQVIQQETEVIVQTM